MKYIIAVIFSSILFVFGGTATTSANLIANGDFESPPQHLDGWTTSGDVRVVSAGPFASYQGMDGYYALLGKANSSGTSSLLQSFTLSGYDKLTISFNWAFDYFDDSPFSNDSFISLLANTGTAATITLKDLETKGTLVSWEAGIAYGYFSETYDIPSSFKSGSSAISFQLVEGSDWGPIMTESFAGIDNVVVTGAVSGLDPTEANPVPEPSSVILLASGSILLAAYHFGKKGLL